MPSADRNASPPNANAISTPAAIRLDRTAMSRRCLGVVPAVRLEKIGTQPGGSITTNRVTNAEMNS